MKKSVKFVRFNILAVSFMMTIVLASPVLAVDTSCKTKNPIIFAHGMGFTPSDTYPHSLPGIYDALKACGATVYTPTTSAIAGTRDKAIQFKAQFQQIQALYPAGQKFNVMGHSHGGLYTRDAISNLGLAPYVSSLTTIASPHRGSEVTQIMMDVIDIIPGFTSLFILFESMLMGCSMDAAYQNDIDLTARYMIDTFNPNTPNMPGVYYQSWTGAYRYYGIVGSLWSGLMMIGDVLQVLAKQGLSLGGPMTPELAKTMYDALYPQASLTYWLGFGTGDGAVAVSSAKWGTYLGAQSGPWYAKGANHFDVINLCPYGQPFDVIGHWKTVVRGLMAKGY